LAGATFTVGMRERVGSGSVGLGPVVAESGKRDISPQAPSVKTAISAIE
jgi:hypothetical protein